ncbi:MAG: carbohydrate ABC transporter permease [Chloroflexi bacterium]|nr:carbohydrate ABC transporter permease [Chloroflexota bacterium]
MSTTKRLSPGDMVLYVVLILMVFVVSFPLLYATSQSFQTNQTLYRYPPTIVTTEPTLQNWQNLFNREDLMLPRWLANSFYVATSHTLLVLLVTSLAAYAFARLKFPGRNVLFFLLLATLMIPGQVTLIPNYLVLRDLKMLNTPSAMILPGVANVTAVFLLRQFFMSIPTELEEAAIIDGASRFGVYWRIVLPLSIPALIALAIFVFQANWNDLLWPLVVTSQVEQRTLPVGLSILNGSYGTQERGLVLAGAIFSTIPVLLVYLVFQRWIIRGVTFTSGFGGR